MMEFTAEMIAGFLGGQVAGDKEAKVHTVSSIEEGEPGALTYLTNPKYEKHLYKTRASIVLVNKDFTPSEPVTATLIKVEDTGAAVLKLLQMYQAAKPRKQGISERASISERATLGEDCYVGDFAVIEAGARIGADCQIYPQVIEWRNCKNTNILGYQPVNHTGGFKSVHFLRRNNNSFNSLFF